MEQFPFYLTELKRWNARVNLTGLKTDRDIVVKHFLDSLAVLPFLGEAASLADLGSGAGFPGLALKLVRPELDLTLVEAREKKAAFLEYLVSCLKLPDVDVVRIHLTLAEARQWGPRFEAVVSRATFKLAAFCRTGRPLAACPGGSCLALKGPGCPPGNWRRPAAQTELLGLTPLKSRDLPVAAERRAPPAVLAYRPRTSV